MQFFKALQKFPGRFILGLERCPFHIHFRPCNSLKAWNTLPCHKYHLADSRSLKRPQFILIFTFANFLRQSLRYLFQHRQPHRHLTPVQEMFGLRMQIELHVAYALVILTIYAD